MQDLVCKKLLVQRVIYRQEPALSGSKDPVGHGLPGNGQTEPAQLLLLSVKRERKYIFAVHDLRQQTSRYDPAARQRTDVSEDSSNAALREASSNRQSCSCSSALLSLEHP